MFTGKPLSRRLARRSIWRDKMHDATMRLHDWKTEKKMIRCLMGICAWAGAVLSLGACHYDEGQSWRECCFLHIVGDETSSPVGRKTIIEWVRGTNFNDDGVLMLAVGRGPWKQPQIASALADFLAGNPGTSSSDYFASLGMTCRPAITPKDDLTRCAIDLPVWVECTTMIAGPFLATPVPGSCGSRFPRSST